MLKVNEYFEGNVKSISLTTSERAGNDRGDGKGQLRVRDLPKGDHGRHDGRPEGETPR